MAKKDLGDIHLKLDKLLEYGYRHDEHLKTLNSKVAKHEEQFKFVFDEFKNLQKNEEECRNNFRCRFEEMNAKIIKENRLQDKEIWGLKIQQVKFIGVFTVIFTAVAEIIKFLIGK